MVELFPNSTNAWKVMHQNRDNYNLKNIHVYKKKKKKITQNSQRQKDFESDCCNDYEEIKGR